MRRGYIGGDTPAKDMTPPPPAACAPRVEEVCGETYDHDTFVRSELDGVVVSECRRCGAEFWDEESA